MPSRPPSRRKADPEIGCALAALGITLVWFLLCLGVMVGAFVLVWKAVLG